MRQSATDASPERAGEHLPFARVFLAIGGIYIAQSLVSGLTFQAIPAVLRANELPLDRIGLLSLALLPWALKFIWAPWIERYRLGSHRGNSRRIVVTGEIIVAVALIAAALSGLQSLAALIALLLLAALASATIDIACDGYAVEQLAADRRGWGNTAQVGGAYLGFMIGGGAYLWLVSQVGFQSATITLAIAVLVLTLPFAVFAADRMALPRDVAHRPSLRFAVARPEVRLGLVLIFACGVGPRIASGLLGPFMVDKGMDLALLGVLNGIVSIGAGLFGTLLGGALVHVLGAPRAVGVAISLQMMALAALWAVSTAEAPSLVALVVPMAALTATMAIGFVAMYALLMGASSLRQAGVDFTIFQCADAAVATLGGTSGGMLAAHLGYQTVFLLTVGAAGLAMAMAWWLTPRIDKLSNGDRA